MITLELDIEPIEDEMEHPLHTFKGELKEFLEHFGWRLVRVANYEDDDE